MRTDAGIIRMIRSAREISPSFRRLVSVVRMSDPPPQSKPFDEPVSATIRLRRGYYTAYAALGAVDGTPADALIEFALLTRAQDILAEAGLLHDE
jgi:hypothetical protein